MFNFHQKSEGKYRGRKIKMANYKKAYSILMEYWDSLPDDEKNNIDKRLKKVWC